MTNSNTDPVALPSGLKELLLKFSDLLGSSRRGQRSLLKLIDVAQSSMGTGNYDDSLHRTGEIKLITALSKVLGPITAIDIGAHHGAWSLAVLKNSSHNRVIALEPDPKSFTTLSDATQGFPGIVAMNVGVGDEEGEQTLYVDPVNSQLSTLLPSILERVPESSRNLEPSEVSVQVIRLRSAIEKSTASGFLTSTNCVNLIKIDTEGLELPIMRQVMIDFGSSCAAIQFEFNSHALANGQLIDDFGHLLGESYQLFRLAPRRLIPRSDLSFSAANVAGFSNWVALDRRFALSVAEVYRKS